VSLGQPSAHIKSQNIQTSCRSAFEPGASGLPYYCTPHVWRSWCNWRASFGFLVFGLLYRHTATQLPQWRIQVVHSNKVARKRLTESNRTPAMDLGHMDVVLKQYYFYFLFYCCFEVDIRVRRYTNRRWIEQNAHKQVQLFYKKNVLSQRGEWPSSFQGPNWANLVQGPNLNYKCASVPTRMLRPSTHKVCLSFLYHHRTNSQCRIVGMCKLGIVVSFSVICVVFALCS